MSFTEEPIDPDEEQIALGATTGIAFGPRLIDQNGLAVFESSTYTLSKILAEAGIKTSLVNLGREEAEISENAFELPLPVLVITSAYLSSNPNFVSLSINLISSYIYDYFTGIKGEKTVRCKILFKGKNKTKKVSYSGPVEGFGALKEILDTLKND